jgi:hypothetical protein
MTKHLFSALLLFASLFLNAQEKEELSKSEKIIKRGVELHGEKKYRAAIDE